MRNQKDIEKIVAEASTYEYGCGLNAFAGCLISNLKKGKIDHTCEGLEKLYQQFKDVNKPHSDKLDKKSFIDILTNELDDPVASAVLLNRPLRLMLADMLHHPLKPEAANSVRNPGVMIDNDQIRILAKSFNIRTEAYASFNARLRAMAWDFNPDNEDELAKAKRKFAIEKIMADREHRSVKMESSNDNITEQDIQNKLKELENNISEDLLAFDHSGLPANAPVLKLYNEKGTHWQRIMNDGATYADNIAKANEHNHFFKSRSDEFSKKEPDHEIVEGVKKTLGSYLEERSKNPERYRPFYQHLFEFESRLIEERRVKNAKRTSTFADSNKNSAASGSKSSENKADGTQSIFEPLANICKAFGNYCSNHNGGTGLFGIIGLIFGWIGQIFDIFKEGVNIAKEMKLPELFGKLFSEDSEHSEEKEERSQSEKVSTESNSKPKPKGPNQPNNDGAAFSSSNEKNNDALLNSMMKEFEQKMQEEQSKAGAASSASFSSEKSSQKQQKQEQQGKPILNAFENNKEQAKQKSNKSSVAGKHFYEEIPKEELQQQIKKGNMLEGFQGYDEDGNPIRRFAELVN